MKALKIVELLKQYDMVSVRLTDELFDMSIGRKDDVGRIVGWFMENKVDKSEVVLEFVYDCSNDVESVAFELGEEVPVEVIPNLLYDIFSKSNTDLNYVCWLEKELNNLKMQVDKNNKT